MPLLGVYLYNELIPQKCALTQKKYNYNVVWERKKRNHQAHNPQVAPV